MSANNTDTESKIAAFKFKNLRKNGKFVKLSLNEKVRQLVAAEFTPAEIAKHLGCKYQRVRNVMIAANEKAERDAEKAAEQVEEGLNEEVAA